MYFSRAKRKMMTRIIWLSITLLASLYLYITAPTLQQTFCSTSGFFILNYICPESTLRTWNLFYHLGGNGPWIPRASAGRFERLPLKCEIDQVHMISRHAERFPTRHAGARHLALLHRLKAPDVHLEGSLDFVSDWEYFTNTTSPDFENLTSRGPYAGTVQAHNTGRELRERYGALVKANQSTNLWACSSHRDVATARYFATGFFGSSWEEDLSAKLHIIPEDAQRGADTLTPGDTCLNYIENKTHGHDRGYIELGKWQDIFSTSIAHRLKEYAGGLSFSPVEIYSMMEMCGFEILARGSSPWCDIFTHQEWLEFEYGRDLLHFYRAGPGNKYAGAMGWLWLNATTALLTNDAASGVYFSFVHDGDIIPLLATLGTLDESKNLGYLPSDKMKANRNWRTSDVVPMGGRLIIERVTCSNTGLGANLRRSYVRLSINDGVVNLQKSMIGGGLAHGVGVTEWANMVRERGQKHGSFEEVCGLSDDAPRSISFLQPQYQ